MKVHVQKVFQRLFIFIFTFIVCTIFKNPKVIRNVLLVINSRFNTTHRITTSLGLKISIQYSTRQDEKIKTTQKYLCVKFDIAAAIY